MKRKKIVPVLLCLLFLISVPTAGAENRTDLTATDTAEKKDFIKWMDFSIPYSAMKKAMELDIRTHETKTPFRWVELLAVLGSKYGGNWKRYRPKDMDALVSRLNAGEPISNLTAPLRHYGYYYEIYEAVLGNFVGPYELETAPGSGEKAVKYGLKAYSPIAKGYGYSHYDDFGTARSFGFRRKHLGNDLIGSVGTPVIAAEGGRVEALGWNRYGGWRVGIRSSDRKRYYYYAHLRKNRPYAEGLKEGQAVKAGDVIGYLGRTGYSDTENVNNITKPHLHFGLQIIFDESQKEGNQEIWIDVYDLVKLLARNRSQTVKNESTKEYRRALEFNELDGNGAGKTEGAAFGADQSG